MNIEELYSHLKNAYSDKNLNRITGKLIDIYRAKNFSVLRDLTKKISDYITIDEESNVKYFSKLVMLYHPDKGASYREQIASFYNDRDYEKLEAYSHILFLSDLETVKVTPVKKQEPVEDDSEYVWENTGDGFEYFDADKEQYDDGDYGSDGYYEPDDSYDEEYTDDNNKDELTESTTFYNAVKLREYGRLDIEFPPYYLEDFEVINFAESEIDSLDGIGYCRHVVNMDLSNNNISDISEIAGLLDIKELYLSNNNIGYIDALSSLLQLQIVDLSNNDIDDITPLLALEQLEFVNLMGNKVTSTQIEELRKKNIVVIIKEDCTRL